MLTEFAVLGRVRAHWPGYDHSVFRQNEDRIAYPPSQYNTCTGLIVSVCSPATSLVEMLGCCVSVYVCVKVDFQGVCVGFGSCADRHCDRFFLLGKCTLLVIPTFFGRSPTWKTSWMFLAASRRVRVHSRCISRSFSSFTKSGHQAVGELNDKVTTLEEHDPYYITTPIFYPNAGKYNSLLFKQKYLNMREK